MIKYIYGDLHIWQVVICVGFHPKSRADMGPWVSAILCARILEDLGLETQNPSVMVRDQFGETSFGVTLQAQPKRCPKLPFGEHPKYDLDWWLCSLSGCQKNWWPHGPRDSNSRWLARWLGPWTSQPPCYCWLAPVSSLLTHSPFAVRTSDANRSFGLGCPTLLFCGAIWLCSIWDPNKTSGLLMAMDGYGFKDVFIICLRVNAPYSW